MTEMEKSNLSTIVKRLQSGDTTAFAEIYKSYWTQIVSYFRRSGLTWENTEDLTQEVFLRVFRNVGGLRRVDAFVSWMYTIAENLLRDWQGRINRMPEESILLVQSEDESAVSLDEISSKTNEDNLSQSGEVEESALAQEVKLRLQMAMDTLTLTGLGWKKEQLEEYNAAQEGLERLVETQIDSDALWNRIFSHLPSDKPVQPESIGKAPPVVQLTPRSPVLMAAADKSEIDEIRDRIGPKFREHTVNLNLYSGKLYVRDRNSALFRFRKSGQPTTDLDGKRIEFYLAGAESNSVSEMIENGRVVIDFSKLRITLEEYAQVRGKITLNESTIIYFFLGDESSA